MACAFKCDRCGKYYDKSTLDTGLTLCKSKNTRILDLCKECKASLTDWLNHEEYIEQFIKHRAFKFLDDGLVSYITLAHFIEALERYFDYGWDDPNMEKFIKQRTFTKDLGGPNWHNDQEIIMTKTAKECLINYLDYEWKDELYG